MEMKNICGKIPMDLHAKVRQEIEQREISTQEFLQQVIEEHFMEKGVDAMAARTIAVQVTEDLYARLKAAVAWKGCKQKDFLISIITKAIEEVEAEHARTLAGTSRREQSRRMRMLADSWKKISRQKNPRRTVKADQTDRKNRQSRMARNR